MNELKSNVNLPLLYEVRKDAIEKTKDIELGERICDGIDGEDILEIMTSRYWTKHLQGEDALLYFIVILSVMRIQDHTPPHLLECLLRACIPEKLAQNMRRIKSSVRQGKMNRGRRNASLKKMGMLEKAGLGL